ncbi:hypothetical protein BH10BAC5_BH10BAC5_22750 [soil metagenome]
MKVNSETISKEFERNRQEMIRLEETSFLSTGAQIKSEGNSSATPMQNVNLTLPLLAEIRTAEVRRAEINRIREENILFHPFRHKYMNLEENINGVSLYKSALDLITEKNRGLGFEISGKTSSESFHPFKKKYDINDQNSIKKVF